MKRFLFVSALFVMFSVAICEETLPEHHDIAVKVPAGTNPNELAERYGYRNKGQIGTLDGFYLFELQDQHRERALAAAKSEALLQSEEIEWAERQVPQERRPRPHQKRKDNF